MKTEFDPYWQMNHLIDSYHSLMSDGLTILEANGHFIFWRGHHIRGWYYYLIDKDIAKAKQEFYVCGRLDEELNKRIGNIEGKHLDNAGAMEGNFHTMDVLLSDNRLLIQRRTQLNYIGRDNYMYKNVLPQFLVNEGVFQVVSNNIPQAQSAISLIEKSRKAKNYTFDAQFFEAFFKGDKDGMVKAIKGVSSKKMQNLQLKVDSELGPWDNALLSMNGITYTKLAWMHGYELEIKSPLVSIANEFFPVKPLAHYDDVYDFANMG